jgi:hypothetical protein
VQALRSRSARALHELAVSVWGESGVPMHLSNYHVEGRRPVGLIVPDLSASTLLGDYLGRAAFLETASALAFARLGRELELHGAPDSLVERCALARVAELRHARGLGRLAERHGVVPPAPVVPRIRVRSLVDIALENIVEGFVRTTYGAAAAQVRARSANENGVRLVMEDIARDELVHAELAFDIALWLQAEIDPVEGVWVEDALRHAAVALAPELDAEVDPELCSFAGVPNRSEALAIWSDLSKTVWHGLSERVWDASSFAGHAA